MRRIEARLQRIPVESRPISDLYEVAPADQLQSAAALAEPLAGVRVLHICVAPPEAADASRALAPLLCDLGLEAERAVLHGDAAFHRLARELADGLRGAPWAIEDSEWLGFREACEAAAVAADLRRHDLVIAQGAASAALIEGRRGGSTRWLWRTGLDASDPDPGAWEALRRLVDEHAGACFALPEFVAPGLEGGTTLMIPGAIDPLAPALREPAPGEIARLLGGFGIDLSRPLATYAAALDSWADPLAVIEAWRLARVEVPGLQLAVAGRVEPGDPEAAGALAEVRDFAGGEPDLHLLSDRALGGERANALVRASRCLVDASLGDRFDPALSAAHWRGTAVIAQGAGAASQVEDGQDGFLVSGREDCGARLALLASDPRRAVAMGRCGREHARERFLVSRLLADELDLIGSLLGIEASSEEPAGAPV